MDFISNLYSGQPLYDETNYDGYQDDMSYVGKEVKASLSISMILEGHAHPGVYLFMVISVLFMIFLGMFVVVGIGMGYDSEEMSGNISKIMA